MKQESSLIMDIKLGASVRWQIIKKVLKILDKIAEKFFPDPVPGGQESRIINKNSYTSDRLQKIWD